MPSSLTPGKTIGPLRVGTTFHVQAGVLFTPASEQPRPGTYWVITQVIYTVLTDIPGATGLGVTLLSGADRLDYANQFTTPYTGPPNQVVPRSFNPPLTILSGSALGFEAASTATNANVHALVMGAVKML